MWILQVLSHKRTSKKRVRVSSLVMAAAVTLSSPLTVKADTYERQLEVQRAMAIDSNLVQGWPRGPVVTAEAAILMEAETGTILYAKNIHKQEYPASTTKILTCLIAAERCELDEMVTMSHSAVYDTPRGSNHIALDKGESITMEDALNAILVRSANEVSFAVGEHISGTSWEDFGPIMNERARELGCENSNFVNPNGLPDENHYTTAYDLALIARAFFDNEMLAKKSRATKLEILPSATQPDHIIEHTKNQLLPGHKKAYPYLVGSKTGYTDAARNCLVSCAEKDGLKLICVVLKDSSSAHYDDTIALFDYGFGNFTKVNVAQSETKYHIDSTGLFYSDHDVFGSSKPLLTLNTEDFLVLPIHATFAETTSTISYDTEEENQAALITYTWNGVKVGTASVDFVENTENSFTFDEPMRPTEESPEQKPADTPVVFVNVLKIAGLVLLTIVALGVLFLAVLFVRRNPGFFSRSKSARRRAARRRRHRSAGYSSSHMTTRESRVQDNRARARQARNRRRRRKKRSDRFRDYDF